MYFCSIIIIMLDFGCDRLGSPSDLAKSWGGGGVTVECRVLSGDWTYGSQYHLIHFIWGARSPHSAVSTGAYKWRETWVFIYSSGRPHGPLVFLACREDWIYIDGLYESVPDSYVKYSVINGPTDGL